MNDETTESRHPDAKTHRTTFVQAPRGDAPGLGRHHGRERANRFIRGWIDAVMLSDLLT